VWQYLGPYASEATGSFRRYADGSNVISWGLAPLIPQTFSEIDASGHDVLDVTVGSGDFSYRTVKAPLDAFDVGTLRATAGHP
jgi:ubiquinone/menaquinone biosynthesis C-methylase UbiE